MNEQKDNMEIRALIISSVFRNCRDRANKNGDYSKDEAKNLSEDEKLGFLACVDKSVVMNSSQYSYLTNIPDCSYMPKQAYLFNPQWEDKMFICGDKFIQRLIFYDNQQWEDWEQLPEGCKEEEVLRNLQAAQFKYKATYTNILKNYEWKAILFPIKLTDRCAEIINQGFCYVGGRDRNFRPLMILRGRVFADLNPSPTIEEGMTVCCFAMEYIKANYFIPGKVENWIICVDFGNLGLSQLPFKALKALIITLQSQYRCIAARLFILNVSSSFHFIWSSLKVFLEEHTKRKITITKESTCPELKALFAPEQLEKRFGGEAPDVEDPVWPPRIYSQHCHPDLEKQMNPEQFKAYSDAHPDLAMKVMLTEEEIQQLQDEEKVYTMKEQRLSLIQEEEESKYESDKHFIQKRRSEPEDFKQNLYDLSQENFQIADIETTRISQNKFFHSGFQACKNLGNLPILKTEEIKHREDSMALTPLTLHNEQLEFLQKNRVQGRQTEIRLQSQLPIEFNSMKPLSVKNKSKDLSNSTISSESSLDLRKHEEFQKYNQANDNGSLEIVDSKKSSSDYKEIEFENNLSNEEQGKEEVKVDQIKIEVVKKAIKLDEILINEEGKTKGITQSKNIKSGKGGSLSNHCCSIY